MGKQSKKKGKKLDKKEHKAKLQERRERVEEQLDSNNHYFQDDYDSRDRITASTIFEGDRVWFHDKRSDEEDTNTRRGLVRKIEGDFFYIQPIGFLSSKR
jgi:hypothetical protein